MPEDNDDDVMLPFSAVQDLEIAEADIRTLVEYCKELNEAENMDDVRNIMFDINNAINNMENR